MVEGEEDIPLEESRGREFIPVRLASLQRGGSDIETELSIGGELDRGESGVVRGATIRLWKGDRSREYPVALKRYLGQEEEQGGVDPKHYNNAYEAQLVYYEALRRAGVRVIPTFRLAKGEDGNTLGIVMTNLEVKLLDPKATVGTVESSRKREGLPSLARWMDRERAKSIGLELAEDSWMLQYSDRWVGRVVPRSVVSDIIGIKIWSRDVFNRFLDQPENRDLAKIALTNPVFVLELI